MHGNENRLTTKRLSAITFFVSQRLTARRGATNTITEPNRNPPSKGTTMTARTMKVRETLRALATVSAYIVTAAAAGTGLALAADAHAAPIVEVR